MPRMTAPVWYGLIVIVLVLGSVFVWATRVQPTEADVEVSVRRTPPPETAVAAPRSDAAERDRRHGRTAASGGAVVHPLLQVGPLNLSTGGLLLLASVLAASSLASLIARRRKGAALVSQVESIFLPAALGALLGARVWYGVLNWDLYARDPALFVALRIADLAWPGGLVGGALVGWLWACSRSCDVRTLADTAALALPAAQLLPVLACCSVGRRSVCRRICRGASTYLERCVTQRSSTTRLRRS
jgi:hypothetical protein